MFLRLLIFILAILWTAPAEAAFTLDSPPTLPSITNGSFESIIGSEWACTGCSVFTRVTTPTPQDGTYSLNFNGTGAVVKQTISISANTAYSLTAYVQDNTASAGATLKVTYTGAPQDTDVTSSFISNPGFESGLTGWACVQGACTAVTTPVHSGTSSLQLDQRVYDASWEEILYSSIRSGSLTLLANQAYTFKVWVNDNSSTYGGRIQVKQNSPATLLCTGDDAVSNVNTWTQLTCSVAADTVDRIVTLYLYSVQGTMNTATGYYTYVDDLSIRTIQASTETLCTTTDTVSNNGVWTKLTCNIPDTNTVTTPDVQITSPDGTNQFYIDKVTFELPTTTKMTLPSGSTGRTVKLFNESWAEAYSAVAGNTYAIITSTITPGTYYWQVSGTDGATITDKSNWVTVNPSTFWTWTDDSSKYTLLPWDVVLAGDTNSNGSCIDGAETGCYMKLQYRGADYASFGPSLGNNLALGKTVTASSSKSGTCGQDGAACNVTDGNYNTRWKANTANNNEWVCIDLGASTTFNRVDLTWRELTCTLGQGDCYSTPDASGATQINIQVSPTDTGCSAGDFANVTGGTPIDFDDTVSDTRAARDPLTTIAFAPQTKRYVKINATVVASNGAFWEVMVFNEGSGASSDISHLAIDKRENIGNGGPTQNVWNGLRYDSYVTNGDGSITFTKNVSGWFDLTVNYKKMSSKVWRKRFTIKNTSATLYRLKMSNVLLYPAPASAHCKSVRLTTPSEYSTQASCVTKYYNGINYADWEPLQGSFASAGAAPVGFGLVADSGCNAQWVAAFSSDASQRSVNIAGTRSEDTWFQHEVNYGWSSGTIAGVGSPFFVLPAGTTATFDISILHSIDTDYNSAFREVSSAIAITKEKTELSSEDQVLWGHAFQAAYSPSLRDDYNKDICVESYLTHISGRGYYPNMSPWVVMGLGDKRTAQGNFLALRKSVNIGQGNCASGAVCYDDAFTGSPSLISPGAKLADMSAIFAGYMVAKGWVTVQSTCPNEVDCMTIAERDALGNTLMSNVPASGLLIGALSSITAQFTEIAAILDVEATLLSQYILAFKAVESTGYTIDQAKLTAMKTQLQALYSDTDGYIHATKYGHWLPGTNNKTARRDTVRPPQANFTVPAGHTNASLSIKTMSGADRGIWSVKKNGVDIVGSPFDMYSASPAVGFNQMEPIGANTGTMLADITNISDPFMYKATSFGGDYNTIEIRVKSYTNGPTGIQVFYTDGVDCTGYSETCSQNFTNVIIADGTWQVIQLPITDPEWGSGDTINNLRIDFIGQTATGTMEIDYIHLLKSGFPDVVYDDFNDIIGEITTTTTVSTGDEISIQSTATKNASASGSYGTGTGFGFTLDKIIVGGTFYEEDNANFTCGSMTQDCTGGFSNGWRRWHDSKMVLTELLNRLHYNDSGLTDAQLKSHLEHLGSGNQGAGTLLSYIQDEKNRCIPVTGGAFGTYGYWQFLDAHCNWTVNGASFFLYDSLWWTFGIKYLGDNPVWYKWDEQSPEFVKTGTWAYETDKTNYYQRYVWKSSTATNYIVFSGVPYSDAKVYMVTGSGQGTVKIYFDNGSGYDAGTTVDLSTASNPVYAKTGLSYASNYKIKIEIVSGTGRVDYISTNSKPSFLLQKRIALEQTISPWPNDKTGTDIYGYGYNSVSSEGASLYNTLYLGDAIQNILRRYYLEDNMLRRYK